MNVITHPTVAALLLLTAFTTTAISQQKRPAPLKPQPKAVVTTVAAPTFDTLVPADSYAIYGEVRGVGQLIQSNALNDVLEPILNLAGPPKNFKTIVKWLNVHADEIMTSRLLVATWPIARDVPETIVAIEFASQEEAKKFLTTLNSILPTLLPPVTAAAPEAQGENKATTPPKPQYHLLQAGSLILLTPKPLSLRKLKPAGSKPMAEDTNFRTARNRFNSEPLFVYLDLKLMDRQEEERRKKYEESERQQAEEQKREQAAAAAELKKSEDATPDEPADEEKPSFVPEGHATLQAIGPSEPGKEAPTPGPVLTALSTIGLSFFRGESKAPEGIGFALSLESDSFDVRALFVNQPGEKSDVVPFLPLLIAGPPLVPESPNILPADTQLFAMMSLDLPQIYSAMSKPRPNSVTYTSRGNLQTGNEVVHEPPFAAIEKKLQMNLKDGLLPLLGSEIALSLPLTGFDLVGLPRPQPPKPDDKENQPAAGAGPVLLISLRDKEGVRALMPKIIDSLGFKGASSFAQTERREDTEIVSYLNLFSYAFIGNFIVLSADAATTRHVVDSYLKHETLAGESQFTGYTRWQPRPAHGQLYISPALMESYKKWAEQTTQVSDQTRAFLTRFSALAQPVTYSLSNEGLGPFHELHLPRNLVLMAVAGMSGEVNKSPVRRNEGMTTGLMFGIAFAQEQYKRDKGAGSYGTLEQLIAAHLVSKEIIDSCGYKIEMTVSGDKFEVFATPAEYGKSGIMSYFIDTTRVLRGADRVGAAATSSDPPVR